MSKVFDLLLQCATVVLDNAEGSLYVDSDMRK